MRRKGSLLGSVILAMWLLGASTAHAAFPGQNGKIVFNAFPATSTGGPEAIYTMNPDGSGRAPLTSNTWSDQGPSWSPDGTRIAFTSLRDGNHEIYVMNADGSGATRLTFASGFDSRPAWSPDGRRIAFSSDRGVGSSGCCAEVYVMNADGTDPTRLTNTPFGGSNPAWSPDGAKIAYTRGVEIMTMNPDGSGVTRLTSGDQLDWFPDGSKVAFSDVECDECPYDLYVANADGTGRTNLTNTIYVPGGDTYQHEGSPAVSPDGRKIAFTSDEFGRNEVFTMNADGSGKTRLTSTAPFTNGSPSWQPILHDIPQSADTLHMSLVPMLRQTISTSQCAARGGQTSTHGAPLAFSSCNPPGYLPNTMARLGPSSSSSVDVTGVPGDPVTSADEADLTFNVSANDVRARPGGGDYDPSASPDATLSLILRWSDTYNGSALRAPATGSDLTYSLPVSCVATADPSLGSSCSTNTTADALAPGTILEGRRTVITLSRWWLYDSGLNATRGNADDRMFAQSGIYIP